MLEVHVPVSVWRFKSSLPHQSTESPDQSRRLLFWEAVKAMHSNSPMLDEMS
jgi:hypothetical protein